MLDDIIEVIFDIVLEVAAEVIGSKKVPMWIRVILAFILLLMLLGICGLLIYIGFDTGNTLLKVLGAALIIVFAVLLILKIRKHKN